ncbi:MAG: amino acid adenylation domain-containing protein, partial [Acidobacteria bacterium]|nr:amino acid adenylation domain-containing protein [Acidobacteriota bacterium]
MEENEKWQWSEEKFRFAPGLYFDVMKLSSGIDLKLHIILQACLAILLEKYTGNPDIITGSPILKQEKDAEFINTILAFRTVLTPLMTFREFLGQVKETIVNATRHQNFPLQVLIDFLDFPGAKSKDDFSLFDVALLLSNIHDEVYLDEIDYTMLFSFHRTDNAIEGTIKYKGKLYLEKTILQIISHYNRLLELALQQVDVPILAIDILSPEEKHRLLIEFNDKSMNYPGDKTFTALFEEQVKKNPCQPAVISEPYIITYTELNKQANRLAGMLRQRGVGADTLVAVTAERSNHMIIAVMAVMKSGGAYLPVDPDYPVDRIAFMIKDSGTRLLLAQASLAQKIPFNGEIIIIEEVDEEVKNERDGIDFPNPEPMNGPANLVYIIYTSGSTGKPKGVMVQHNHFVNIAFGWQKEYRLQEIEVCLLQMASFSFDVFAGDLARTFLNGGKMIINPTLRSDAESLYRLMNKYRVSLLESTPAYIIPFMKYVYDNNLEIDSLRLLILGSDSCPLRDYKELVVRFAKRMRIVNSYGVTETTIDSSYYEEYNLENIQGAGSTPIGKPLPNVMFFILNQRGEPTPPGVPGELYIGGDSVTRGYLDRPELTAERFKKNVISHLSLAISNTKNSLNFPNDQCPMTNDRFYRTGDLASWTHDGNVVFLGRGDYQVKIRGYRIELGEIENKLLEHQYIKEALVSERIDINRDKYLCGYYIADRPIEAAELRELLSQKLPDYMVPWFFVQLEQFPLTPNGKIDRKALPDPDSFSKVQYAAPRDEFEKGLLELWIQILGQNDQEPFGINHRFFDLGGNSLKAIIMSSQLQKLFNVKITLADIFNIQTIRGIAGLIKESTKVNFTAIEPAEKKFYYPLSSAQKRLFVLQQMEAGSTVYNIPIILLLKGDLVIEKLALTFTKLIRRHESFRTSFILLGNEPVQRIHDEVTFKIEYEDLSTVCAENRDEKIRGFIRAFDLSKAPLIRVGLLNIKPGEYILIVDMHHIISDGTSNAILSGEFMALYAGDELPVLRIQYKDYALWQENVINKEAVKKQEEWWLKEFSGDMPILNLPLDYKRPAVQAFSGNQVMFNIESRDVAALKRTAVEIGPNATLYMVILSIYSILLAKLSGQEEVIIGGPTAGRTHSDLQPVIGMFINTLAFRTHPNGQKTFAEFLNEMKDKTAAAFENQDYPFERMVEKILVNRDLGRNPLFDAAFILQNIDAPSFEIPGLSLASYPYAVKIAKFDLLLQVFETGNEQVGKNLTGVLEYCTELFKIDTIERFIGYFKQILTAIIDSPSSKIAEFEIIPGTEKKRIIEEFNATGAAYPGDKTIHELFSQQALKIPDHVALVGAGEGEEKKGRREEEKNGGVETLRATSLHITYLQLNEQSNQLAGLLIEKGVLPGNIVGIILERSIELITGIIGILKAGGAYLPIDPGYPPERINYMLRDSGTFILLANSNHENKKMADCQLSIVNCEVVTRDPKSFPGHFEFSGQPSQQLAYIIYTSGSTGKPKGVMVTHRNVVRLVMNTNFVPLTKETRILQTGVPVFDATTFEMWGSLLNGGQLVLVHKDVILNAHRLAEKLRNHAINTLWLSASLFNQLLQEKSELFAPLNYLLVGGDVLAPAYINRVRKEIPTLKIINGYGPTENTTFSTTYLIETNFDNNIPIGRPINNSTAYIFDKGNHLQPIGIWGELYVGGDGVARGYLNNPELTAERFKKNVISHLSLAISNTKNSLNFPNDQ